MKSLARFLLECPYYATVRRHPNGIHLTMVRDSNIRLDDLVSYTEVVGSHVDVVVQRLKVMERKLHKHGRKNDSG